MSSRDNFTSTSRPIISLYYHYFFIEEPQTSYHHYPSLSYSLSTFLPSHPSRSFSISSPTATTSRVRVHEPSISAHPILAPEPLPCDPPTNNSHNGQSLPCRHTREYRTTRERYQEPGKSGCQALRGKSLILTAIWLFMLLPLVMNTVST